MKTSKPKSILIIGMAGGLAKITAHLLAKKYPSIPILGVDPRPIKDDFHLDNLELYQMTYTRGILKNYLEIKSLMSSST